MSTLESKALMVLLENALTNGENKSELIEFIRTKVLDAVLESVGLYHVFYRGRDPHEIISDGSHIIELLKSFATEKAAVAWIMKEGKDIADSETGNYGEPIVLIIIYCDNTGMYDEGDEASRLYRIGCKRYPSFAFDEQAYNMLMDEHVHHLSYDNLTFEHNLRSRMHEYVPYWINYVHDGIVTRGNTKECFDKLGCNYFVDNEKKQAQHLADFEELIDNPDALVTKKTRP